MSGWWGAGAGESAAERKGCPDHSKRGWRRISTAPPYSPHRRKMRNLFPRLCGGGEQTRGPQRSTPTQQGAHTHSHERTYVQAERPPSRDTHTQGHTTREMLLYDDTLNCAQGHACIHAHGYAQAHTHLKHTGKDVKMHMSTLSHTERNI